MVNVSDLRKPGYEISPQFLNRWSPRSFLEKDVPEDVLFSVFEAARWAPSASNQQPWNFIIARTKEDREKFYSFIMQGNLVWCKKAPVLAVIISKTTTERGFNAWHAFDAGTAWGYLALEASRKGLITHAMGGFEKERAREALNVPDGYELHAVIAIGYQGEKDVLPENLQEREQPSTRRPLNESLFEGSFREGS
ncbi:NADH dehydrogenase [Bacillus sp. SA1-12]|uniref:nitroreductase family protein n=1 Tax=Bacillus sp. SA1-12 TaxID=1455638 RepID=UPI00062727AD|nr:nitroreductase family protein [Bacillus sp. SA1-12]KKI89211.1 NADH dehydrogenase [Bacillus sp. SA1-12]